MTTINIIGTIMGTSGYDNHTRGLFNSLYKLNQDIKLDVPLPQNWISFVNDAEMDAISKPFRIPDVTIMISTPPNWRLALSDGCKKFIGFLVWEGDKIPKYWIEYLLDDRINQIWVPSKHTREAIAHTIDAHQALTLIPKIKIVPHGVDLTLFSQWDSSKSMRHSFSNPTDKFIFICNKGWRGTPWDRGGVQYLIKTYCEEFKKDENVQLLLKLNPAYLHPTQLKQAMDNLNLPQDRAEIKIITDNVPYNKLIEFYNMGNIYVCPTRAEAFDLGSAEAMACGLPIITTNYGGQIEHMDDDCAWFVGSDLEEVKEDVMYEGIKWSVPDIEDLKKKMRYAYEHKQETKEKGKKGMKKIQDFTWDISAKKALDFIN